jgi:hypothetical protein
MAELSTLTSAGDEGSVRLTRARSKPLLKAANRRPLGKPAPNAPKYFAAVDIVVHAADSEWLSKATRVSAKHWQRNINESS